MAKARRVRPFSSSLSPPFLALPNAFEIENSPRCTKLISCGPSPTIGTKRRFFFSSSPAKVEVEDEAPPSAFLL